VAVPLVELGVIVEAMFWIALAVCAYLIIKIALAPIIALAHQIPIVGGSIAGAIEGLDRKLSEAAAAGVKGVDKAVGLALHSLAEQARFFWNEFKRHSLIFPAITAALLLLHRAVAKAEALAHGHAINLKGINDEIKRIEKRFKGIEHGLKDLSKLLLAFGGIDALVHLLKHLFNLRKWVQGQIGAINRDIAGVKGSIAGLKGFLGVKNGLSYLEWAAGIVAAVIGIEAVNLFKCPAWLNQTSKRGCGLWNGIEDLFGFLADLFIFTHFCDLWAAATPLLETFLSPLVGMISTFADGACSHRPSDWQTMGVSLDLPTPKELTVTVELP